MLVTVKKGPILCLQTKVGRTEDQDEIEFVLIANGTSFVALGWRPSDITAACKSWPFDPSANRIDSKAKGKRQAQRWGTRSKSKSLAFQTFFNFVTVSQARVFSRKWRTISNRLCR